MKKSYIATIILVLALWVGAIITSGGKISHFLSLPCLIVVVVIPFAVGLANYNLREMGSFFKAGFREKDASREVCEKGIAFFQSMQTYVILSGLIGTLVGTITVLALLDDPSRIGRGMALALITILYSLLLVLLITGPFKNGLKRRLIEIRNRDRAS